MQNNLIGRIRIFDEVKNQLCLENNFCYCPLTARIGFMNLEKAISF